MQSDDILFELIQATNQKVDGLKTDLHNYHNELVKSNAKKAVFISISSGVFSSGFFVLIVEYIINK